MEKKPLYRKVNKRTHNGWAWYYYPKERYRFERHKNFDDQIERMSIKNIRGLERVMIILL